MRGVLNSDDKGQASVVEHERTLKLLVRVIIFLVECFRIRDDLCKTVNHANILTSNQD